MGEAEPHHDHLDSPALPDVSISIALVHSETTAASQETEDDDSD